MSFVLLGELKVGRVVSIYKGDDPSNVENDQPFTILQTMNVLFEKIDSSPNDRTYR